MFVVSHRDLGECLLHSTIAAKPEQYSQNLTNTDRSVPSEGREGESVPGLSP